MKNSKKKVIVISVSILLVIGVCIGVFLIFRSVQVAENDPVNNSNENFRIFEEGFTDIKVTDEKSAKSAVASVAEALGINDVEKELKVVGSDSVDGDTFYRMQQYYDDIPVYGRDVVLMADDEGTVIETTSNTLNVKGNLQTASTDRPTIDQNAFENALKSYFTDSKQFDADEFVFSEITADDLVIYSLDNKGSYTLAYRKTISFLANGFLRMFEVVYDPDKNEIISANETLNWAGNSVEVKGKKKDARATGWQDGDTYSLYNDEYKIKVFDFSNVDKEQFRNNKKVDPDFEKAYKASVISSKDNSFDDNSIYALSTVSSIAEYYKSLGDDGFSSFHVALNGHSQSDNAGGGSTWVNDKCSGIMLLGSDIRGNDIDMIGHEYTHAVSQKIVRWLDSEQTDALQEGLSDIFGILIETKVKEAKAPKWFTNDDHSGETIRDCISPRKKGFAEAVTDVVSNELIQKEGYGYCYSTVISHAAYLMNNGISGDKHKKIDDKLLAKIWYKALYLLHPDATFEQCANAVYTAAYNTKGLTSEQKLCVREAFGEVGLDVGSSLSCSVVKGATLYALSADNKKYKNYHLKIVSVDNEKVMADVDITDDKGYKLDFPAGTYFVAITDNQENKVSDKAFLKKITIIDGAAKENAFLNILTDFFENSCPKPTEEEYTAEIPTHKPTEAPKTTYTAVQLISKSFDEIKEIMGGEYSSEHIQLSNAFSSDGTSYIYNYDVLPGFAFETYENDYRGISIMDGAKLNDRISSDMTYNQITNEIGDMEGMLVAQDDNIACSNTVDGYRVIFCFIENDYIRKNKEGGKISSNVLRGGNPKLQSIGLFRESTDSSDSSQERNSNNSIVLGDVLGKSESEMIELFGDDSYSVQIPASGLPKCLTYTSLSNVAFGFSQTSDEVVLVDVVDCNQTVRLTEDVTSDMTGRQLLDKNGKYSVSEFFYNEATQGYMLSLKDKNNLVICFGWNSNDYLDRIPDYVDMQRRP